MKISLDLHKKIISHEFELSLFVFFSSSRMRLMASHDAVIHRAVTTYMAALRQIP